MENIRITMRDGTRLAARIWLPEDAVATPVPAVLEYIPYRKRDMTRHRDSMMHPYVAGHGNACLRVDIRGSGDSEGVLTDDHTAIELQDGCDILEWIAAQPRYSGKVGMIGISWGGFDGLQIAGLHRRRCYCRAPSARDRSHRGATRAEWSARRRRGGGERAAGSYERDRCSRARFPARESSEFDLVILGTPVWAAAQAPAVNAYIDRHRAALDRLAFFCTQGKAGAAATLARIERRLGHPPLATIEVTEGEIGGEMLGNKVEAFLSDLRDAADRV